MATSYDPEIIRKSADVLYLRASIVVALTTIAFGLFGGVAGEGAGGPIGFIMGAGIAGALGYLIGQGTALWIRLAAQTALCLVQIEENGRPQRTGVAHPLPEHITPVKEAIVETGAPSARPSVVAAELVSDRKAGPTCRKCKTVAPEGASRCVQCLEKLVA